ncbi:pleckstrin homology domain-containing family G member 5-like [Oppia nitens]|uniref:pleckstrin homology domain-containing family G member 5-like n=1 Tax=Oppia nitens TaxID=1686743 RepID=UPI0023DCC21B|nr:pleckstrin homology domain-containing family G member 5-like [Oppia nitens]
MSQRHRRGALMVSCENLLADSELLSGSHEGSLKAFRDRQLAANRKSGGIFFNPFKSDREKLDQLTDLLNLYQQTGIPEQSGLLTFRTKSETTDDTDIYYLEDHWMSIVANAEELPKKVQNQNDAIWELLETEVFYLRRLKVITDLFLACLCNLQSECLLNEIDTTKMFSNIVEVSAANHQFWFDHLLPMLSYSRQTHQPLNPLLMKDGFLMCDQLFHPYMKYCLEHSTCLQYVKENHKNNELFKAYVVWCETHKDCERLRLMDLLVKPMQRLTKYSLLLKAILKKTDSDEHKIALKNMNECVERFVYGVDAALRRQHEQQKLASIVTRIESYDAIDCNNDEADKLLKEYIHLDLTQPMNGCSPHFIRHLLVEGSLKLKDSFASKVDVHCFLFTDLLLICKSVNKKSGNKVRVIRQPFIIDRVVTQELKDGTGFILLYLNEFKVANALHLLYSSDTKTWIDYIKKAQDLYRHTKSISSEALEITYFRNLEEEEDYDFPSMALLATSRNSPRSSSRSSLVHSHSGSVDMSDATSSTSLAMIPPVHTPNYLQNPDSWQQPPRAVSFELGELRNPSLVVEDSESFGRSHSVDNRSPVAVTITSPRPERRAFLLRNSKGSSGQYSQYPNTLSVNLPPSYHPMCDHKQSLKSPPSLPSIQLPVYSSPTKSITPSTVRSLPPRPTSPTILNRSLAFNANKPPLLKTKNISGLLIHSAPASEGPSPVHSLDNDTHLDNITQYSSKSDESIDKNIDNTTEDPESIKGRISQKRNGRAAERRYHTADSIEHLKKEKDSSIHKRLSWNYGQHNHNHNHNQTHGNKVIPSHCERILCNKHFNKCLSAESVYSSSGFSSTCSVPLSVGSSECEQCGIEILDHIQEMDSYSNSPAITPNHLDDDQTSQSNDFDCKVNSNLNIKESDIKIDICEVKDGISSVQIRVTGTPNQVKPSKADLKKMKEFLLTNYNVESSEV